MQKILLAAALACLVAATPAFAHGDKAAPPAAAAEEHPFGRPGDPKKVAREVLVSMGDDMRFRPAEITVRQGETVRFRVKNNGKAMHEMVLGTLQDLKDHAETMRKHPGMEHDEPYMVHVAPGKTGTIVWQFTKPGEFRFGCLVAGHFEAGMVGKLTVPPQALKEKSTMLKTLILIAALLAPSAHAEDRHHPPQSDGEVRRVDKDAQKITIRHGALPQLDMAQPMTMVYRVKDPAFLDKVKAGDKVKFDAEKIGGAYTVTKIEPAK